MALISFLRGPSDWDWDDDDDNFLHVSPSTSRRLLRRLLHSPYSRNRRFSKALAGQEKGSTAPVKKDDGFQVKLDVQQFAPEEIVVKATGDNVIVVEAKHEEKEDEHGYISRHFVRKYKVPEGHDIERVESKLSTDGVLTITAPKLVTEGDETERQIPISFTGRPYEASLTNNAQEENISDNMRVNNGELLSKKRRGRKSRN